MSVVYLFQIIQTSDPAHMFRLRYYLRDFQRLRILKSDKNGSDQIQLFYLKFKINLALINSYRSGTWAILKLYVFSNN